MVFFDNNDLMNSFGGGGPDPYAAYDEYRTRRQLESDRQYELQLQAAKRQKEQIALQRGQAEANRWYNEQTLKLSKAKFEEDKRQFDLTFGENQRQFNTTASGYLDGKPTLAREQFQDSSLQGWTDKALTLSRLPKDWVTLARMQRGVSNASGNIPGLSWAAGGQVGNTTFAGQPEANSLGNLLGNMGVGTGQGGSGGWASQAAQTANGIATTDPGLRPDQAQLYQTAREFAMNPQGAAPGWLERLDPLTRDLLQGAAEDQGLDWASALSRHQRSRWGGGASATAA